MKNQEEDEFVVVEDDADDLDAEDDDEADQEDAASGRGRRFIRKGK